MRVVHLSYYYGNKNTSGAPIAATRLHQALLDAGVDSHFVCVVKTENGTNVHVVPKSRFLNRLFYIVTRSLWACFYLVSGKIYMPNLIPLFSFNKAIKSLNPDIVHAHLIYQDMLSFKQLAEMPGKLIITLHDLSAVNARDPYPGCDRRFIDGFGSQNSSVVERWIFRRKKRFVEKKAPLFIGPSKWICDAFSSSIIGRNHSADVVCNIVDPVYGFDARKLDRHDRFTILFGAYNGRKSPLKGWADLENALELLPERIRRSTIVNVFGENSSDYDVKGVRIHFIGEIWDSSSLRDAHHKADVFALPSRQDNAPQVKFEALLDGLPVLAFDRTGCAEYIESGVNGWVAQDGDLTGYAKGIAYFHDKFVNGETRQMRSAIAENACRLFSNDAVLDKIKAVYRRAAEK